MVTANLTVRGRAASGPPQRFVPADLDGLIGDTGVPTKVTPEIARALRGQRGYRSFWLVDTGTSKRMWKSTARRGAFGRFATSGVLFNDAPIRRRGAYQGQPYAGFVARGIFNIPAREATVRRAREAVPRTIRENWARIQRRLGFT